MEASGTGDGSAAGFRRWRQARGSGHGRDALRWAGHRGHGRSHKGKRAHGEAALRRSPAWAKSVANAPHWCGTPRYRTSLVRNNQARCRKSNKIKPLQEGRVGTPLATVNPTPSRRSEEHTSELQTLM